MFQCERDPEKLRSNPSYESGNLEPAGSYLDPGPDSMALRECMYVPLHVEIAREYPFHAYRRYDGAIDHSSRMIEVAQHGSTHPPLTDQALNQENPHARAFQAA